MKSPGKLFVFVLNLNVGRFSEDGKRIGFPMSPAALNSQGDLILNPPPGIRIVRGETIFGYPLMLETEGDGYTVRLNFRGGGEMVILTTSGQEAASKPGPPSREAPANAAPEGEHE